MVLRFISDSGYIGSFNLRLFPQAAMSVIGMILAVWWFLELKKQRKCSGCKECGKTVGRSGFISMLAAGFTYGIAPCPPVLLLVVVTGALSKKMGKEIPDAVKMVSFSFLQGVGSYAVFSFIKVLRIYTFWVWKSIFYMYLIF